REINTSGSSKKLLILFTSYTETSFQIPSANTLQRHEIKYSRTVNTQDQLCKNPDTYTSNSCIPHTPLHEGKAGSLAVNFEKIHNSALQRNFPHGARDLATLPFTTLSPPMDDSSLSCIPQYMKHINNFSSTRL
ncbi:unnamed protein product, partial [Heterotrigona itama]